MTSVASSSYSMDEEESSQASTVRSRLSHSSHSLGSRGTYSTNGSGSRSRASNGSRSTGSRSTNASRSTGSSRTSSTSRTSTSSRYSRNNPENNESDARGRLSTIHSVASEGSHDTHEYSQSQDFSQSSSRNESHASSHRAELSLPSSFGGSAYTRKSVKKEDGAISVVTQDIVSVKSDTESVNTETQLALRVEKETKPMMHLVRLLKEMDPGAENNTDSKNNAIASLINEFEEEVVNIEQRIINPMLTNGEEGVDDKLKQIMEGLPPDWIALIDEESGDVYYSNEITGETTWDRPEQPKQITDESSYNESYNREDSQDSYETETSEEAGEEEEEELPPDWVALEDVDSGDIYYANEVTGETTWDRPKLTEQDRQKLQQLNNQQQQQQQPQAQEPIEQNSDLYSSSNFSNDYQPKNDDDDEEESQPQAQDDDISADDSLPSDWIPLVDPDSGETYFCNEVTGETTWDKPKFDEEEKAIRRNNKLGRTNKQLVEEESEAKEDNHENNEDEDLPEGWFSIVDPDSGDVYYSNEITGETTWDKPINDSAPQSPEYNTAKMNEHPQFQREFDERSSRESNNESADNDLPAGWIASIDPDSGEEYYFNEETGETTWDKPDFSQRQIEEQHDNSSSNFSSSEIASEWFAVVDPQSGETYFANERTGETSWEKPQALLVLENEPHNSKFQDDTRLLTNGPAQNDNELPPGWFAAMDEQSGEEYYVNEQTGETTWDRPQNTNRTPLLSNQPASEDEDSMASGWFAVVEPASGDIYYANEQTGATSWDKPRRNVNTSLSNHLSSQSLFGRGDSQHDQSSHGLSKMSLSMHENTVYENDSVTSSQY